MDGKGEIFRGLFLILLVVGWASILMNHGLRYGIDFRGGTLVYVRFAGPAPLDRIRKGLASAGLADSTIQTISDTVLNNGGQNDVVIGLERGGQDEDSLDPASRRSWTCCTRVSVPPMPPAKSISIQPPKKPSLLI